MNKKHCHPGTCFDGSPLCKLEDTREEYRRLWCEGVSNDKPRTLIETAPVDSNYFRKLASPAAKPVKLPCVHLGNPTGETIQCPSCSGTVKLKLIECEVHGKCLPGKVVAGVQSCLGCKDNKAS